MTNEEQQNLKALLDLSIPECRPVREFFLNLRQKGVEVAKAEFVRWGIRNSVYWAHAEAYLEEIGLCQKRDQGRVIVP